MPNIPTIPLPQVESEPLPTPYDQRRRSPEEFGAGIGRGLEQLGEGLDKLAAQADATAAQEAETSYAQDVLDRVHGPKGFRQLKGHAALDASAETNKELEQRRNEIAAGLTNERQKRLFLGRTQGEFVGAMRAVELHTGDQVNALQEEAFRSRLTVAGQNALAVYADPIERQRQVEQMVPWLELEAERQGLRGVEAGKFVEKWQAAVVEDVLQRLVADEGRSADARAYLAQHEGLLGDKAAQFARAIRGLGVKERGRAEADRLWDEAKGDPVKVGDLARGIQDTELFDEVDRRLKARISEDHALRVASDSPRESRLETAMYRGGGLDRLSNDYLLLSDEGKARVEAKRLALVRSLRAEGSQERREQAEIDRYLLATFDGSLPLKGEDGKDQVSIDIDHSDLFARASPTARELLKTRQKKAKAELDKDQGVGRQQYLDQVTALAGRLGYTKQTTAEFKSAMLDERSAWLDENPSKPNPPPEVVKKIFADALLYGDTTGGSMWSKNRFAWQAKRKGLTDWSTKGFEEQQPGLKALEVPVTTPAAPAPPTGPASVPVRPAAKVTSVDAIPEAERSLIVQAYKRRNGREPSGSEILQRYQLAHPEGR